MNPPREAAHLGIRRMAAVGLCFLAGACGDRKPSCMFENPIDPQPGLLRRVSVVLDLTSSLTKAERAEVRLVAADRIVPKLGPGDVLDAYRLRDGSGGSLAILTSQQIAPLRRGLQVNPADSAAQARLQSALACDEGARREVAARAAETTAAQARWAATFNGEPDMAGKESDYAGTLEQVFLQMGGYTDAGERWLIVVGDLVHEARSDRAIPPLRLSPQARRLAGSVHVVLVHPSGPRKVGPPGRQDILSANEIEEAWRDYFSKAGIRQVTFAYFQGGQDVLPPVQIATVLPRG
jgi:hypothetical protein